MSAASLRSSFAILDRLTVRITSESDGVHRVVTLNYAAFAEVAVDRRADLEYTIAGESGRYTLQQEGEHPIESSDLAAMLFDLEKEICIAAQLRRPALLFLHAAALERNGKAYLLAGDSGGGKSTTAWGLLHHGFRYLSDELSPIELDSLSVHAYPHALCVKRLPPPEYPLPTQGTIDLGRTIHVPVDALPSAVASGPCSLGGVLFIRYDPSSSMPSVRRLRAAEAGARMYVTALNVLAHPRHGVDAVAAVATRVPCWALETAGLAETCELVDRLVSQQSL